MAGTVGSWILTKVRNLGLLPAWAQIGSTSSAPSPAVENPRSDPARVYQYQSASASSKRDFRSLSPDFSFGLSIFPEFSQTPPPSHREAGGRPAGGSGFGSRLRSARHTAIARGHRAPQKGTHRLGFNHEQEKEDSDAEEQAEEQIQLEMQRAAVQAGARKAVHPGRTSMYEPVNEDSQSAPDVDVLAYSLSWRVNEGSEVVRAALTTKPSEESGAPAMLRVVGAKSSGRVEETDPSPPGMQSPDSAKIAPFSVRGTASSMATASSPGSKVARKRKAPVLRAEHGTKRQKGAELDTEAKTEVDELELETTTRPTRHAAKRAKMATKSALWTEALHDDTYLRRAEGVVRKTKGQKT